MNSLFKLNYFEKIQAHQRGKILVFKVVERPFVSSISFEGNDEIDDDDLKEVIKTKEFTILDRTKIQNDQRLLQKHYEEKGYYLAKVESEQRLRDGKKLELVFKISEFEKVKIKKIIFLGNKEFNDYQLKDLMETRENSLFSFMSGAGSFKEFNFQTDIERLKYFYKTKGFLQVNLGSPDVTISEDKRWIFITIKINEGPKYHINSISFRGETIFTEEELLSKITLKAEDVYSEEALRINIKKLTELYQDEGYAFANVLRTLNIVPGENKVDLEFSFEKGNLAKFGRINITGNYKTRDKVIRRELTIEEGQKFSGTKLRVSQENVNRLGFFEPGSVIFNTKTRPGNEDIIDIDINVKERNTGQISLGAGYSTATGAFMQASIAQNNFLGKGQNLTLSLNISDVNKTYNLGFTEPYLNDTLWTAGGDFYSQNNTASTSLSYKREGFNFRVGYPIFDYTRLFGTYKYEDTEINTVNDPTIDSSLENGVASIVRVSMIRDIRNNTFEPSSGYYLSGSSEYSGLGGVKKWFKLEGDARYYKKIWRDLVFRSRLYASRIYEVDSQLIPRTEKLTLGGARNLRGYAFEGIGPKVTVVEDGVNVVYNRGGTFAAYTSLELEHPISREAGLKWVLFFDAGDAGEFDEFKANLDYGFGLRWFSPIGVLRFEFGYPINPENENAGSQFHFDIGQLF
ncbi:MAG: outer membrane protein assembly factor BamA [Halobacteriovoraceae bacterium]|nr:outer membrane protein assembly factor BamA [Halobacteriovoraceae bacterium]